MSRAEKRSGSSVYHKYCWDHTTQEEKDQCIVSKHDPDQGEGRPRKKFGAKK